MLYPALLSKLLMYVDVVDDVVLVVVLKGILRGARHDTRIFEFPYKTRFHVWGKDRVIIAGRNFSFPSIHTQIIAPTYA